MFINKKIQYCSDGNISKLIYRFNANLNKIPACFLIEIDKLILKFIWKFNRTRVAQTVLNKKNSVGGLILPNFKT